MLLQTYVIKIQIHVCYSIKLQVTKFELLSNNIITGSILQKSGHMLFNFNERVCCNPVCLTKFKKGKM